MYCRGHQLREELCKQYDIKPVGHFKLLNGRTVVSDAGNMDITDEYIIFDCTSKTNQDHHESIYCGRYVADDFCRITGYTLPPIFDPLHHDNIARGNGGTTNPSPKWNPVRKQLYNIVLLIMTYQGNIKINSVIFDIKRKLEDSQYIEYFPKCQIKSVNTYLIKMNKTFEDIINALQKDNNLRDFNFDLVLEYMEKNEIPQHLK
jgi:hypothetical protein